jgi:LysM repeat protein
MFMSEFVDRDRASISPFVGLVPSRLHDLDATRHVPLHDAARSTKTLMATMPVILAGTLAFSTLGLAPSVHAAKQEQRPRAHASDPELAAVTIDNSAAPADEAAGGELDVAAVTPTTYTVRHGDTVSGIAGRYGLSTASVLALNGLGWKSLIFPGQTLRLAAAPAPAATPPAVPSSPSTAPASTTPAPPAPAPTPASTTYVIQRGDTVTSIARRFGVTIPAILSANGLSTSSIIYTGRTLVIPGGAAAAPGASAPGLQPTLVGAVTVPLSPSMQANAQIIVSVGRSLGVPDYGIVIALATAAQESGLQNLSYGDRDSVGLFQQRPSTGWGTVAQLTTPRYAAELFYGGPSNPNKGRTRGLLDIPGWQSMTLTQAAQAVQISGSPNAYAKWEASARAWFAQLG